MKLGISQPTFLPWNGYIALINFVNEFVILDNVQFEKRSWQQRNKILLDNKEFFLTVPVKSKNKFTQKINQVQIDTSSNYIKKHLSIIRHAYVNTKYFDKYYEEISKIYNSNHERLIDLNLSFLAFFLSKLKIKTKITFLSNLNINSNKEKLIEDICITKNCKEYISTVGAEVYLNELKKKNLPFKIKYFEFNSNKNFKLLTDLSELSVLHFLFNYGEEFLCKVIKGSLQIKD